MSNYRANCDMWVDFVECGVKLHRNRPTWLLFFWSEYPIPPIFGPPFWLEKVPILHSRVLEKAQKRSKIAFFWPSNTFYCFSFTRPSIQNSTLRSLTPLQCFHNIEKNHFFCCEKHVFFGGHPRFFEVHGLDGLLQLKKKGVCQMSDCSELWHGSWFFLNVGWNYVEIDHPVFFLVRQPIPTILKASKWGQNGTKTTPKWCQKDAKMIPKWPKVTPDRPQKLSKITPKWPIFHQFLAHFDTFLAQERLTMVKRGKKNYYQKPVQKSSKHSWKLRKNTQNPLRMLPDTPTCCTLS